ncbi:MAG: FG-GAP-like repeat-containing protein [Paludibacter sp.]|nr:FG-GAP-like repeat-containing protein [Paludibacter sp.]
MADFNGDGLKDLLIITNEGISFYKNNGGTLSADNYTTITFDTQYPLTTFNATYSTIKLGDFNGDGLLDFVLNEHCNSTWKLAINNGNWGFDITPLSNFTGKEEDFTTSNDDKEDCIVMDFNNDGKSDVILVDPVYSATILSETYIKTNVTWYSSTGTGFNIEKSFTTTDENYTFNRFNTTGDFDGDGREELFSYGSDLYNGINKSDEVYIHSSFNTNFEAGVVKSITDGLGKTTHITYQPLTYNNTPDNKTFYTKGSSSVYPVVDLQMPIYCVSKVEEPDGVGGVTETEFAYSEARVQLTGRGFLGFKNQTISNASNNRKIISTTDMDITYYIPHIETTDVLTLTGTPLSKTESSFTNSKTAGIFLSQPAQTVEHDYLNNLSKTTEFQSFDNNGNLTGLKTTQGDLITTQAIGYIQKGSFCPNKVSGVTITREQGGDTNIRTKSYTYDDKGNLIQEITDPGDSNQKTMNYTEWTAFGQPKKTEISANNITRSSSITISTDGRFVESKTDILGQTVSYNWDPTRGLLNWETNRLGKTSYTYNGFGQLTRTDYPDGTFKTQAAQWALSNNAFGAKFFVSQEASGLAPTYAWFDGLQRQVVTEVTGLNGNKSRVFTQYRTDGKTDKVSAPTFDSQPTAWDAEYDYYTDGRIHTVTTPLGTSTITYPNNDKTTKVQSPDGTNITVLNSAGQVLSSSINGKKVTYTYYASGQVNTTTPESGQLITMAYDLQGNRIGLTDPDAGITKTYYNGLGELISEKVTNNSTRGEITSTYTYNATTGLLETRKRGNGVNDEITNYGYDDFKRLSTLEIAGQHKQTYTYGDYDRVITLTELINGTKTLAKQFGYDDFGRIARETFPSGYYTENHYDDYGNLYKITDSNTPARTIWEATEANARGQLTNVLKGAKETVYGYDETKGQLTSMTAAGVVNYSYGYNPKNNLEFRSNNLIHQKEQFTYDTQNRLTNWDIRNATTDVLLKGNSITYDATTGNITEKSDLNDSSIPNDPKAVTLNYEKMTNPHALTTITPVTNAISGNELAATYTDFRKIKTLSEGGKNYVITYGVDDQRRVSVQTQGALTQTKYYMGDYEEEVVGTTVRKIHYLSGAIYIQNNNNDSLLYTYTDNQGSLIALTNEIGDTIQTYAYDPWGVRRNPYNWELSDNRTSWLISRGYTGHEHLDAFGIINMNGRVYDPLTAQFFSPDPFIQAPGDWLNYNRYGYCMNNPTMHIDPSGYQAIKEADQHQPSIIDAMNEFAKMEKRLGISNSSNGSLVYDFFLAAVSKGYKGTLRDFQEAYERQSQKLSFNGEIKFGIQKYNVVNKNVVKSIIALNGANYVEFEEQSVISKIVTIKPSDVIKWDYLTPNNGELSTGDQLNISVFEMGTISSLLPLALKNSVTEKIAIKTLLVANKFASEKLFGVNIFLSGVNIVDNNFSTNSILWSVADTGMSYLALTPIPGLQIIAGLYLTGRFVYQVYTEVKKTN